MDMIGSGKLSKDNLPQDRLDILNGIRSQIQRFRENAYEAEKEFINNNKDRVKDKERPNNVISILGGRGSGKTSVALTINNELEKKSDFMLDIIDPSKFNVEDNALGWIIYSFEDYIDKWKKSNCQNDDYCDGKNENDLAKKYSKLKENYIYSRKFYRENLSTLIDGRYEYDKTNQLITIADRKLENSFREFIEEFCRVKRNSCKKNDNEVDEPLIFITFDDVDLCPEKGPEILDLILNYLSHPNIVCLVLGDYATFSEALVIDLWKKSNIPVQLSKDTMANNNNTLFNGIVRRADDILGKVLPYNYRFELNDLSLIDRLSFTPFGKGDMPKLYELLDKINISKVENNKEGIEKITQTSTMLKYFIEPMIDIGRILDKIYSIDLTRDKRRYEGYDSDVEENIQYNNLVLNYKKLLLDIDNESEKKNELKKLKYNELKKIKIFDYSYVLSGNPRGLINLYYKLKSICEKKDESELQLHISPRYYGTKKNVYERNYKIYTKLFEAFYNSNIEISNCNDEIDIREILKLNKEYSTLEVNNSQLKLIGGKYYEYINFNIFTKLLTIRCSGNKQLTKEKSAFIQLFYDLAKIFFGEKIVEEQPWNFNEVCIYRRKEDLIEYSSINFKYFYDFYCFQTLYKACLPLIIIDRRVPIDIRNRLKAIALSIIKCIADDERSTKSRFIENVYDPSNFEYFRISDIKNKHDTINIIASKYFPEGINPFIDSVDIMHQIMYQREQEYYNGDGLNFILKKSRYYLACNEMLCITANPKKSISKRCKEIKNIILSYEENMNSKDKDFEEIIFYADNEDWDEITKLLVTINENIINFLILEISKSEEINNDERIKLLQSVKQIYTNFHNVINRNKQASATIGLDIYTQLQEKLNEEINKIIESQMDDIIDFEDLLSEYTDGVNEEEIIENVLKPFVSKMYLKKPSKENIINRLKSKDANNIIDKKILEDINIDNFKEKMMYIIELMINRWCKEEKYEKIESLLKDSISEYREFIIKIRNNYEQSSFVL